ncbi:hypothetical protein [Xanthomonas sp. GPE 39]|nr:hypothetical protein [Xanthomonas sp. GPE 39]
MFFMEIKSSREAAFYPLELLAAAIERTFQAQASKLQARRQ